MTDEPGVVQVRCPTTRYADRNITSLCSSLPFTALDSQAAVTKRAGPTSIWIVFKAAFHKEKTRGGERTEIKGRIRDVQRAAPGSDTFINPCCVSTHQKVTGAGFTDPEAPFVLSTLR